MMGKRSIVLLVILVSVWTFLAYTQNLPESSTGRGYQRIWIPSATMSEELKKLKV